MFKKLKDRLETKFGKKVLDTKNPNEGKSSSMSMSRTRATATCDQKKGVAKDKEICWLCKRKIL